jgi:hypothetical protein
LNWKQNPYVVIAEQDSEDVTRRAPSKNQSVSVYPFEGAYYLNRDNIRPGMITKNDKVAKLFYKNGFVFWGGNWNYPLDYAHFQTSKTMAELLSVMSAVDAEYFFDLYAKSNTLKKISTNTGAPLKQIMEWYMEDPSAIMQYLKENRRNFIRVPLRIIDNYRSECQE